MTSLEAAQRLYAAHMEALHDCTPLEPFEERQRKRKAERRIAYEGQTFVYLIENRENGRVKIGVARDVKQRLLDLQTACGCTLVVHKTTRFESRQEAMSLERELHHHFEKYRVLFDAPSKTGQGYRQRGSEWFDGSIKTEAIKIMEAAT